MEYIKTVIKSRYYVNLYQNDRYSFEFEYRILNVFITCLRSSKLFRWNANSMFCIMKLCKGEQAHYLSNNLVICCMNCVFFISIPSHVSFVIKTTLTFALNILSK